MNYQIKPVKPWYKSKTIWFNIVLTFFAVLDTTINLLQPVLGEQTYPIILFVVSFFNLILRSVTDQGIQVGDSKP